MKPKKSWRQRLSAHDDLPRINPIPDRMRARHGAGSILIPAPRQVDAAMRSVPKGKLITVSQIGKRLAVRHGATIGCTVTTGIFAWIAAHAANEDELSGRKKITPYWRTLKAKGELNPKYPGGIRNLKRRLQAEGQVVVRERGRHRVRNYEDKLVKR